MVTGPTCNYSLSGLLGSLRVCAGWAGDGLRAARAVGVGPWRCLGAEGGVAAPVGAWCASLQKASLPPS
jgi:hypothetical protein